MNTVIESTFKSSYNLHSCHCLVVKPEGVPHGILQVVHGMCDYTERYLDFMNFIADNGFIACGNDCLGHGKTAQSSDELGYFAPENGWQHAVSDMHTLTKIIKRDYPDLPFFMFGHSMGSFFARAYAIKYGSECSGFIFAGTADGFESIVESAEEKDAKYLGGMLKKLGEKHSGVEGRLGRAALTMLITQGELLKKIKGEKYRSETLYKIAFGKNNERIENKRTDYDWVTRDEEVVDKFAADPLCSYCFTVNGFINLAEVLWYVSGDKWYMNMPKDIPMLLLSGDADPIGNYGRGVRSVYRKLLDYRCNAKMKLYSGARHEILNETNRAEVYSDVLEFIENQI